jgi:hypothetical protein
MISMISAMIKIFMIEFFIIFGEKIVLNGIDDVHSILVFSHKREL